MARKTKTAEAPAEKASKDEPKFGVNDLVEASGLQPASVRVALRELGVEKEFGNKYGWNTKRDFDEIVKGMKERSAKRIATGDSGDKAKPAAKKSARKSRGKK